MAKINEAVIFIESSKIEVFCAQAKKILQFPFPQNSVVNFEIVNEDALKTQIIAFFQQSKLSFQQYVIVIGNSILFQKDFTLQPPTPQPTPGTPTPTPPAQISPTQLQEQKQKFLDIVPFQTVISTEIPIEKGSKVIATNKEFIDIVEKSVMPNTTLEAIFPISIFSSANPQINTLTPDIAKKALRIDTYRKYNMYNRTNTHPTNAGQKNFFKKQKKKDVALVGVFGLLLVVLGGMLIPMLLPAKKPIKSKVVTQKTTSPTPSPTATVEVASKSASPSAQADYSLLTVQITYPSKSTTLASQIQKKLIDMGFDSISLKSVSTTSASTIVFGQEITPDTQNSVAKILKESLQNPIIQKNSSASSDIVITIGS